MPAFEKEIYEKNIKSVEPITSISLINKIHSPWIMWFVSLCFVLFQFCLQLSAGIMIADLINSFKLSAFGAGLLSGSYYFIYVLMQTPAGILVDRIGPRRLLSGGAIICCIGCFLFATSINLFGACVARLLMGAGSSFAFVSTLYLISKWFPKERFAMMTGITETVGMIGTLTGNILLAYFLQDASWRDAMWGATFIAAFLSVSCYVLVRDKKPISFDLIDSFSINNFITSLKWMLKQSNLWINGLYSGLIFSVVTVFAALWSLPYLMLTQHVTLKLATFESSFIFVGVALGGPVMGWLYYKIQNKSLFLSSAAFTSALISLWLIFKTPNTILITSLLFFVLGFICSSYIFNYTFAKENTPATLHATSIGFTNTICMMTAPIFQALIGYILSCSLSDSSIGPNYYSITSYQMALLIIPLNQIVAAVIAFKIK